MCGARACSVASYHPYLICARACACPLALCACVHVPSCSQFPSGHDHAAGAAEESGGSRQALRFVCSALPARAAVLPKSQRPPASGLRGHRRAGSRFGLCRLASLGVEFNQEECRDKKKKKAGKKRKNTQQILVVVVVCCFLFFFSFFVLNLSGSPLQLLLLLLFVQLFSLFSHFFFPPHRTAVVLLHDWTSPDGVFLPRGVRGKRISERLIEVCDLGGPCVCLCVYVCVSVRVYVCVCVCVCVWCVCPSPQSVRLSP